jgi:hypothetical protein
LKAGEKQTRYKDRKQRKILILLIKREEKMKPFECFRKFHRLAVFKSLYTNAYIQMFARLNKPIV